MRIRTRTATLFLAAATAASAALSLSAPAEACLWDRDTLLMERMKFPTALELITGKFVRHSKAFYAWRVEDRLAKLKADPQNLALYDDLAVAYDKTGDQGRAIAAMLMKERLSPGKYETYANLGTFLLHSGDLKTGGQVIDLALAINKDAHFGREVYQKLLAEYVLARRAAGGAALPLTPAEAQERRGSLEGGGFARFISGKAPGGAAAVKGVLGMMKFGKHDSPILLEALGDLLLGKNGYSHEAMKADAKQLAARAYLRAAYTFPREEEGRYRYTELAQLAILSQGDTKGGRLEMLELESQFRDELSAARRWYADVERDEASWISEGKDPEKEFERKYYKKDLPGSDERL